MMQMTTMRNKMEGCIIVVGIGLLFAGLYVFGDWLMNKKKQENNYEKVLE